MASNVEVVERLTQRWAAGDVEGAMACVHPDVLIRQPESLPWGGDHVGHAGMGRMFEVMGAELDQDMSPMVIQPCGDRVVTFQNVTWTNRKTGRQADVPRIEVISFRDGMAAEFDVYLKDTQALLGLVGGDGRAP